MDNPEGAGYLPYSHRTAGLPTSSSTFLSVHCVFIFAFIIKPYGTINLIRQNPICLTLFIITNWNFLNSFNSTIWNLLFQPTQFVSFGSGIIISFPSFSIRFIKLSKWSVIPSTKNAFFFLPLTYTFIPPRFILQ